MNWIIFQIKKFSTITAQLADKFDIYFISALGYTVFEFCVKRLHSVKRLTLFRSTCRKERSFWGEENTNVNWYLVNQAIKNEKYTFYISLSLSLEWVNIASCGDFPVLLVDWKSGYGPTSMKSYKIEGFFLIIISAAPS